MIPEYLDSPCSASMTCTGCQHAVKQDPASRRWFITMGHPGFNSKANNGRGYANRGTATMAVFHFAGAGERARRAAAAVSR